MIPQQIQCLGEILTLKEIHDEYVEPFAIYQNESGELEKVWLTDDCKNILQMC